MLEDVINFLEKTRKVKLISHNDPDGITSGAIMYRALKKLNVDVEWQSLPYMTGEDLIKLLDTEGAVIFIDMGASYGGWIGKHKKSPVAVIDHHPARGALDAIDAYWIPPTEEGTDSIKYATAATLAQKIAIELGVDDETTAWLAIVGATGDMADIEGDFREDSLIKELIKKAVRDGYVIEDTGLRLQGKFALDAYELIDYSPIPPTAADYSHLKGTAPEDLTKEDTEEIYGKYTPMVWNKRYINPSMPPEFRENHDAAAAIMNVTDPPASVIKYLKSGNTDFTFITPAREGIRKKYTSFKRTIDTILTEKLYIEGDAVTIAYNPHPAETPTGKVANHFANKGPIDAPHKPVIVYSKDPETGKYFASARIHYDYQGKIDLGKLMKKAVKNIPGATGGGHTVAAGATIPEKYINEFITNLLNLFPPEPITHR